MAEMPALVQPETYVRDLYRAPVAKSPGSGTHFPSRALKIGKKGLEVLFPVLFS